MSEALGSQVSFPGQSGYATTEASYWSLQEADLTPSCILRPSTASDVAQAVAILSTTAGCDFAIKGQGHAPVAGFANINDGVTIDMTSMNSSTLACDGSIVQVAAGASWLDVYQYLDPFQVAVAGGRNGLVGAGGLLVGGGISHFSPRVGWACDNVVNHEVIKIKRRISNCADRHQDRLGEWKHRECQQHTQPRSPPST